VLPYRAARTPRGPRGGWIPPSSPACRLDLASSLADRFLPGAAPIDSGPVLLRRPFGFPLAVDTLPSPVATTGASEALPPLWDMALSIRAPGGLYPPGARRCPAHPMASADAWQFIEPPLGGPRPRASRQVSQGTTRDCPPIYPPHLRRSGPGAIGLQVCLPPRPPGQRLLCGSCASGRGVASGFLPTPPRGAAVAVQLRVPGTKVPRGLAPPSHAPCLAHKQKP